MTSLRSITIFCLLSALLCALASPCLASEQPSNPWDQFAMQRSQSKERPDEQRGGGLIDSLLSDRPFTGLTVGDILTLGFLFTVIMFLRSVLGGKERNAPGTSQEQADDIHDDVPGPGRESQSYRRGEQMWDYLSSNSKSRPSGPAPQAPPEQDMPDLARNLPQTPPSEEAGFDTLDLVTGAKVVYARMHESMARADWEDVRSFTTPEFLEQLQQKISQPKPAPQVMFVEAAVQDAQTINGRAVASVVFSSLIQFPGNDAPPQEVRELWRFEKDATAPGATWRISFMQRQK